MYLKDNNWANYFDSDSIDKSDEFSHRRVGGVDTDDVTIIKYESYFWYSMRKGIQTML